MNLIQIKQIDGLTTTLNSLARGLFDLEEEVSGQFEWTNRIYDHVELIPGNGTGIFGHYANFYGPGGGASVQFDNELDFINNTGDFEHVKLGIEEGNFLVQGNVYSNEIHANKIFADITGNNVETNDMTSYSYTYKDRTTGRTLDIMEEISPGVEYYPASTMFPVYIKDDEYVSVFENASGGGYEFDIILPSDPRVGQKLMIKTMGTGIGQFHRGLNSYHVSPSYEFETIDGNRNWSITGNYGYVELLYNGVPGKEWSLLRASPGMYDYKHGVEPDKQLLNTPFEMLSPRIDHTLAQFEILSQEFATLSGIVNQNSLLSEQNRILSEQNQYLSEINSGLIYDIQNP